MKGKIWDITSLAALRSAVQEVLSEVMKMSPQNHATVLALNGDLGAGKTTFTQYLAEELEVNETVTSPTFVIMKKYQLSGDGRFKYLVHIDAYRLETPEELKVLNFEAEVQEAGNLIVVEWADKVTNLLPNKQRLDLDFAINQDQRVLKLIMN